MPKMINFTPFPNFRYYARDPAGKDFGVIIVKGTFEVTRDGELVVAEEQAPMMFTDKCHGEVNISSLWHPSDLVPKKPTADIIVNAVARAPGGRPLPAWECGIRVNGPEGPLVAKRLRVTGPRFWVPRWRPPLDDEDRLNWREHRKMFRGWELTEPEPATEVALRYELAFGGTIKMGTDEEGNPRFDCDPRNPIGRGLIDPEWTDHTTPQPAPQIELSGEPITDAYARPAPQSLGPIPPAWDPRLPKGGTFDDHWENNRWPDWPEDYDFAYHNSAHPSLICPRYLQSNETIDLLNLIHGAQNFSLRLPEDLLFVKFFDKDDQMLRSKMNLDTVFLNVASQDRDDIRVFMSWRVGFEPNMFRFAEIYRSTKDKGSEDDGIVVTSLTSGERNG